MKKMILSTFVLSLTLSPVYAFDNTTMKTAEVADAKTQEKQNDAAMLAFLIVVDKNEVAAAKKALEKSKNEQVKKYASLMNKEHSSNLHDSLNMGHSEKMDLKETDLVMTLKKNGKDELVVLSSASPETFDKVYIDSMVKGHQEALMVIDKQFMTQVTDPKMKAFLTKTRAHVAEHLQKAEEIQKTLK